MNVQSVRVDFGARARLKKWPSLNGQRISVQDGAQPYTIVEDTLDVCIRHFLAKPTSQHHLYEIQTEPQGAVVTAVLSAEHVSELGKLRDFL